MQFHCVSNRGIFADVIVYFFAHLHTALRAEGNMRGEIVFQKLQNLWVAKVLMSSCTLYILCKILSF